MSNTFKTLPTWVVSLHHGVEHHDHRMGACVMGSPAPHTPSWWHKGRCARRIEVLTFCTKAERQRGCWRNQHNWIDTPFGPVLDRDNPYTRIQCVGHKIVRYDEEIPCGRCVAERPRCWMEPPPTYKYKRRRRNRVKAARGTQQRRAIAEGLADHSDAPSPWGDALGLKRIGPDRWERRWERWRERPLPAWERALLEDQEGWGLTITPHEPALFDHYDDEVFTESEARALEWDEEPYDVMDDDFPLCNPAEVVDEGDEDWSAWLTSSPEEFFDAVGNAWIVEGPNPVRPEPLREGHYVRVWEVAREVGVESRDMVTALRLNGEYVASHQSYVAVPVAEQMKAVSRLLRSVYGERKPEAQDALTTLRTLLLEEDQRAKTLRPRNLRPGAPRPGVNPFLTRSL